MLEKDAKNKTIIFRSPSRDSWAFSRTPSKPANAKTRKQPEMDEVEDAFFRLADRIANENAKSRSQVRRHGDVPVSVGAQELWKELQFRAKRSKGNSKSTHSRAKKASGKSLRKTRSGETRKKAA